MAVLALIVPLGDLGSIGGGGGVPTPPIHLPPGIWPQPPGGGGGGGSPPGGVVMPPIYYPPGISGPPGPWPTPPIHLPPGGSPPGIWGGAGQPMPTPPIHIPQPPTGGGPGVMPPIYYPPVVGGGPGWLPPFPAHPIAPGGGAGGGQPPGIWNPVFPTNPIVIPIPPTGGGEGGEVTNPIGGGHVIVWHPSTGWFLAPVGGLPPVAGGGERPEQPVAPTPEPKSY